MPYVASSIKDMNRRIVYDLIAEKNGLSRAEISRITGISGPTVIKIIDYFEEIGCVEKIGEGESSVGRKPVMLKFRPDYAYSIGIDFSGVVLKIGIVDFSGKICYFTRKKVVPDYTLIKDNKFISIIEEAISKSGISKAQIKGLCIGLPGVVNKNEKTIEMAPLIGIDRKQDYEGIINHISEKLSMPVLIENDANLEAAGEFLERKLALTDDLLFITIGKGLGAGIILNGRLRSGKNYMAGEIGYLSFDKNFKAEKSSCGWLEQEMKIDLIRDEKRIEKNDLEQVAADLALTVMNLCIPLDIDTAVLGKFRDDQYYDELIDAVNLRLHVLTDQNLNLSAQKCSEPGIIGAANNIIEPAVNTLFGTRNDSLA